jgi:inhibitor of KinA sporulation pathway (predicted exonuclease)
MSKIFKESVMENPFDRRIIDVKSVYQMLANSGNAGMRSKIGLFKALQNMGIGWDHAYGPPHRALADAYNTKRAYMFLSSCMNGGFSLHKKIKSLGEI